MSILKSKTTANLNKIEERKKRVLQEKLKNPTKSQQEVADAIGEKRTTVQRDLKYLGKDGHLNGNCVINAIKDADLEIVLLAQNEILRRFKKGEELKAVPMREISIVARESQARYSFLAGENSSKKGGEKKIVWNEEKTYEKEEK